MFARTLLNNIGGPDGLIKVHNRIDDLAFYDDKEHKKTYLSLDKGLATSLASATSKDSRDSDGKPTRRGGPAQEFAKNWRKEFSEFGVKKYDLELVEGGQKVRGYQSLVSLMQRSDAKYSSNFLHGLADDIRAKEDPKQHGDPDIWDLKGGFAGKKNDESGLFDHGGSGRFANDPLDGVLGIMSKNPEAATQYFDSDEGEDRFNYLKEERDWKLVDREHSQTSPMGQVQIVPGPDREDADARSGYGAALEAAMTGQVPGSSDMPAFFAKHDDDEVRVFEKVVKAYGADAEKTSASIPENLRQNMANAVSSYPADVNRILGDEADYSQIKSGTDPNGVSISGDKMRNFLRGVSEDGGAFRTIHDSQVAHIADSISGLGRDDFAEYGDSESVKGVVRRSGQAMGSLDLIRADVLTSQRDAEIDENNWAKTYQYHVIGAPLTGIPYVGDSVQRIVDIGTGQHAAALNEAVENRTRQELIEYYAKNGYPRLREMIDERAKEVGVPDAEIVNSGGSMGDLKGDAHSWYNSGIGETKGRTSGEID